MPIEIEAPRARALKPKTPEKAVSVAESINKLELPTWMSKGPSVSDKERRFFTEQLALMLETGATLQQGIATLSQQEHGPAMTSVLSQLDADIGSGNSFSQALAKHPRVFSTAYVSLVAASEDGGYMHDVLQQLLQMEEKREQLRSTLVSALSYPVFLSLFSVAVVVFVLVVVFPKFGAMFASIYDQLPATTRGLMWLSDVLRQYWVYVVAGVAGLGLGFRHWAISDKGREQLDRARLGLPVVKSVFVEVYLVQSLRVMSLSLANGVSLPDTLASCKEVVENRVFRRLFARVESSVHQGSGISAGFREDTILPVLVKQMISTGEESGNLPKVMARLADFYERELTKRLATLSKMAEPIMLMVMGVVVGILVSSLILPIFKLSRAVS